MLLFGRPCRHFGKTVVDGQHKISLQRIIDSLGDLVSLRNPRNARILIEYVVLPGLY